MAAGSALTPAVIDPQGISIANTDKVDSNVLLAVNRDLCETGIGSELLSNSEGRLIGEGAGRGLRESRVAQERHGGLAAFG